MNIFVLDKSPVKAAEKLCDCHLRKMCVETAQILSGVMLRRGLSLLDGMPKPQNINHPVIVAAEEHNAANWVIGYFSALQLEYFLRFKKTHSYETLQEQYLFCLSKMAAGYDCAGLAKCCGDMDVSGLDIVTAYRKYYTEVKKPQLQAKNLWKFTHRADWTE
jgi:hypothetical protein